MKRDNERPNSAIWLLGDSPPANQKHRLDEPLDWGFPTRHNIRTPIETVMNRGMFVHNKRRIDDRKFYIRNAVKSAEIWKREDRLHEEVLEFGKLVEKHRAIPDFDSWAECLRIGTSFKRRRTEAFFSLACAGDTKPVQRGADRCSGGRGEPAAIVAREHCPAIQALSRQVRRKLF